MLLKRPVLSHGAKALEKVEKLGLKFVKGLRHVLYEAALQELRLFSLIRWRIRGDLIFNNPPPQTIKGTLAKDGFSESGKCIG